MTKSELIDTIAQRSGIHRRDAEIAVDTVLDEISHTLQQGGRVELRGFGSFGVKQRPAREGRNPKTGQSVSVPAKSIVFFKAGKEMRERVDSGA